MRPTWTFVAQAVLFTALAFLALDAAAAAGIRVHTQVSHEVVPVDVDFWSEILVETRAEGSDTPLRGVDFDFSCSTPDGRLALKPDRKEEKTSLRLRSNARGRIRVYYRYASSTWEGEPLTRPRAERVRVKALQYDFDDRLVIQIGMNLAVRSFRLLHAAPHRVHAPEPFLLSLHDAWHPSLDLRSYRSLWGKLRVEVLPDETLGPPSSAPPVGKSLARWIEEAPEPLEPVWALENLDEPDMVDPGGKGGGGLLVPKGAAKEKVLRLPRVTWRRPGPARVKVALRGLVGDSMPDDGEAELQWSCGPLVTGTGSKVQGPALPFDVALRYHFEQARGKIDSAREGLAASLAAEDFISFGRHLGGFFRVQARRLTKRDGGLDPGRATGLLLAHVLANAMETYLGLPEGARKEVLRASKAFGIREEGFPVVDWIDPVVFGYLSERPKDLAVLLLKGKVDGNPASEAFELDVKGQRIGLIGEEGPAAGRLVLSTPAFALVCLPAADTSLQIRLGPEPVLVETMQMLDASTFLTRRSILKGQTGMQARFPVTVDPRSKIEIVDGAGNPSTSFEAKVAVSDRRPPRIEDFNPPRGSHVSPEGGEVEIRWSAGRVGNGKSVEGRFLFDGRTAKASSDAKGRTVFKTGALEAGIHFWNLLLEDAVGLGDQVRSYFYVPRGDEKARDVVWANASATRLSALPSQLPRATRKPVPPTRRPKPTPKPSPTAQIPRETPVIEDDLPVDDGTPSGDTVVHRPAATFVPTPGATAVPPPASVEPTPPERPPAPVAAGVADPTTGQVLSDDEAASMYAYRPTQVPVATPRPTELPEAPTVTITGRNEVLLKVLEAQLCHYVRNNEPILPGKEFKRVAPRITCWLRFENRADSASLQVRWSFLRGESWMKIHEKLLELPRGSGVAQTALQVSKGGLFPEGRYRVEIHGALGLCWESNFQVVGLDD